MSNYNDFENKQQVLNELEIKQEFYNQRLQNDIKDSDTLVIDELGLLHGKSRADIAVINGKFIGYEIKGENDTLKRLATQIDAYSNIFDNVSLILTEKHIEKSLQILPDWCGIILVEKNDNNATFFSTIRKQKKNHNIKPYCIAQLLWSNEVRSILNNIYFERLPKNTNRALLYKILIENVSLTELKIIVKKFLLNRKNWRDLEKPLLNDGLSQLSSK